MRALAFAACALALAPAFGQPGKAYRIAFLETTSASSNQVNVDAFPRGLKDAGYAEGRNLVIDYRSAEGRSDRFSELAKDVVRARPDVIVTRGTPAALAARDAGTIPVVMAAVADPVGARLAASLARPGGHVTGFTTLVSELHGKRLELIKELLPEVKRIGYLHNPTDPNSLTQWKEIEQRARSLGLEARALEATNAETLNRGLEAAVSQRVGALVLSADALVTANRTAIIAFAARNRLPMMYSAREFVDSGGLISYGVDYAHLYYRAASYVDKILKGAKPGDLPIEQPTKLELVINLKTAQALGISVPRELLLRVDKAIQ